MPSFGEQLKREREKRSITLDDISVSTKISTRLLKALEEDHFEQLPGGIFNKGFIRAYAKCVGLDEDQVIADYLVASGEDQPAPTPLPEPPPRRAESEPRSGDDHPWSVPWGSLAIVLLLAALGLAIWRNRNRAEQDEPAPAPTPQTSTAAPVSAPAAEPAPPSVPATSVATPVQGTFTIVVKAREECWVSLMSDGKTVFEGTLTASQSKKISAQHRAMVKAGNVAAVDISFNGTAVPTDGQAGQVKSFSFDESGLSTVTSGESAPAN